MTTVRFFLNDQAVEAADQAPTTTLLNYLRASGKTGTKEGCAEGDCGACTVVMIDTEAPGGPRFRAINSCLMLLPMVQGRRLYTVEGLRRQGAYHPVQEALAQALGSQCGYCTPGVVMSMFEAHYRDDLDRPWKLDDQMCGNLCRCTGYRPIQSATTTIAGNGAADEFRAALRNPAGERAFHSTSPTVFITPTSLSQLWEALAQHPKASLVAGGTDLGLAVSKHFETLPEVISIEAIDELRGIQRLPDGGWRLGATTLLADIERATEGKLIPLHRMLRHFASRQIKNRATIGGNLCNASPIGDLAPVLLALMATLELRSAAGSREIAIEDFFLDYRRTALGPAEILASIHIPAIADNARASSYKVSKRRELDISSVAAAFVVQVDPKGQVTEIRAAYGGVAAIPSRARSFEAALRGQPWTQDSIEAALHALKEDFSPIDDHRGSAWYRQTLAANLARGFFFETRDKRLPDYPERPSGTISLGVL
ncbi:MAG TPA: xanthine dehydrogenase small subunit [Nannocystis exedens]|nr:xanthine dehydrogenase small subunit [Nannocystis exedens]